jgi:hypothetical protein
VQDVFLTVLSGFVAMRGRPEEKRFAGAEIMRAVAIALSSCLSIIDFAHASYSEPSVSRQETCQQTDAGLPKDRKQARTKQARVPNRKPFANPNLGVSGLDCVCPVLRSQNGPPDQGDIDEREGERRGRHSAKKS